MKLFIKNMVCNRCIMAVQDVLHRHGFKPSTIELGEITLAGDELSPALEKEIDSALRALGFELIDDRKGRIIEKIKSIIIDLIHHAAEPPAEKYSTIISGQLHYDYPYLSKLFSEVEGITIEQYIIRQKTEKIKEYLVYDELNLSEIAWRMGYSSVAHLSAQFKKATGLPPSHFRNTGAAQRLALDKVGHKQPAK